MTRYSPVLATPTAANRTTRRRELAALFTGRVSHPAGGSRYIRVDGGRGRVPGFGDFGRPRAMCFDERMSMKKAVNDALIRTTGYELKKAKPARVAGLRRGQPSSAPA